MYDIYPAPSTMYRELYHYAPVCSAVLFAQLVVDMFPHISRWPVVFVVIIGSGAALLVSDVLGYMRRESRYLTCVNSVICTAHSSNDIIPRNPNLRLDGGLKRSTRGIETRIA